MSILIKGMQIPENCKECPLEQIYGRDGEVAKCPLTEQLFSSYLVSETRMADCPLIELPPHGRLIDADALMKQIEHDTPLSAVFEKTMRRYLHYAPTITESE